MENKSPKLEVIEKIEKGNATSGCTRSLVSPLFGGIPFITNYPVIVITNITNSHGPVITSHPFINSY